MTFSLFMPRVLQVSPKRPSSSLLYCNLIGRRRESSKADLRVVSEKSSALRLLFSTKSQAETQQQKRSPEEKGGERSRTHSGSGSSKVKKGEKAKDKAKQKGSLEAVVHALTERSSTALNSFLFFFGNLFYFHYICGEKPWRFCLFIDFQAWLKIVSGSRKY